MPDGSVKCFRIVGCRAGDESGRLEFVGAVTDITESNRAEDAVSGSEKTLRLIVDGIAGIVAIMTAEGQVEFVNNQALEYFGKTLEELKGWATSEAVHPDDLPQAVAAWRRSVETGDPYDVDHRLRRADVVYRWFHSRGLALRDDKSRIVRVVNLLKYIYERGSADSKIRHSVMYRRSI